MKETIKEYKDIFISFLKSKTYLYSIIFVAILSYGFTITHSAIGADDLCLDKYIEGTYILSQKRWGTWLLYNVLNITSFTPFWLEAVVVAIMVLIAIIVCTFMKKILKNKVNIWAYVIFSTVFISNPIIFRFFMYQPTNLSVVVSNALIIILAILLVENFWHGKNKLNYLWIGLALIFPLSMYESAVQTYVLVILMMCLLKAFVEQITLKEVIKILGVGILTTAIGSIGYYIIGKILIIALEQMNLLKKDYAAHEILWFETTFLSMNLLEKLKLINAKVIAPLIYDIKNFLPVTAFAITSFIAILIELKNTIKTNKCARILLLLGVILSNFILIIMQGDIKYRTLFSWSIVTGFLAMYIYININKNKFAKYVTVTAIILLVVVHSRSLNQQFYAEYKKYEKEKALAIEIARDIGKTDTWKEKPLVYVITKANPQYYVTDSDNGAPVLIWGSRAFGQYGTEATKFINHFGFNFKYPTEEAYNQAMKEYTQLQESQKDNYLIETSTCIIVNLDKYMSV